ncbi:unnamed protein product [Acanthoscelides obtectus]|uniref:C2H2-type domain-containing protein n=1 Tax=Acanthoscelides obtectus TaxID=200917 RepID=A0A9P0PFI5_ACAOB|nr:unnamed protein product [Acanthoscelides obtectus]CAK1638191.1 Zinc finger protein 26 [Acanthoscelides obtectus]
MKSVVEPDSKRSMSSAAIYSLLHKVKDEHWDGVNQVKPENQLLVEVKLERPDAEPTVDNMKLENMGTLPLIEEFNIKSEYNEDVISDLTWNSAKIKKQWKREQEYSQVEEGQKLFSCYVCNYTSHCKKGFIVHMKRHNCHIDSNLEKSQSVSMKSYELNEYFCITCNKVIKILKCTFCDFRTAHQEYLTKHMLRHTASSRLHICKHCNVSFKKKQSLCNHILKQHPDFSGTISIKIYECLHCALKTTNRTSFIEHMAKHNTHKPFKCINCRASFKTKLCLDDHVLKKHPEFTTSVSRKIHECTHCEYKTTYAHCLAGHMMKHTGAKLNCTKCDASFATKHTLNNHILQKHPEFTAGVSCKVQECSHCEYKTTESRYLARHMMRHTKARLTCAKCDASFTTKQVLDNHVIQNHPEFTASVSRKIHECTYCEYKTTYSQSLTRHMMEHTGVKFTCEKCDASFKSKKTLDNHILQKHPEFTDSVSRKIHECTHCEYKTTRAYSLAKHIMKHTGAKFVCIKCDASFKSTKSLDNHVLQRHPEFTAPMSRKIHKCTHCEFKSTYAQSLSRHIVKHIGAKCTNCDASFISRKSLVNHILQKHPELTASVSSKIHECTHCEYKSICGYSLARHMKKHTGECTK